MTEVMRNDEVGLAEDGRIGEERFRGMDGYFAERVREVAMCAPINLVVLDKLVSLGYRIPSVQYNIPSSENLHLFRKNRLVLLLLLPAGISEDDLERMMEFPYNMHLYNMLDEGGRAGYKKLVQYYGYSYAFLNCTLY